MSVRTVTAGQPTDTECQSTQELLVALHRSDGEPGDAGGPQRPDGRPHGGVAAPVVIGGEAEAPAGGLAGDRHLAVVFGVDLEAGVGEDPAVVGAAGAGPVLVHR